MLALFPVLLLCMSTPRTSGQTGGEPETVLTLDDAIQRAEASEPTYAAASAARRTARLDRGIARAAMLPAINFHNQGIYTQPTRSSSHTTVSDASPRFIASNDVREYMSQGVVSATYSLGLLGNLRKASAAELQATAEQEIARRGLVTVVTGLFYGELAATDRIAIASHAHDEAVDFLGLTMKREQAREAAHADVVKAQLEEQQRARAMEDAQLAAENARLELGVLLFPDPNTPYRLAEEATPALGSHADIQQAAAKNNPELKSALAAVNQSNAEVLVARNAYLPTIGINYTYGIDAPQFAFNGTNQTRNLGYATSVAIDLPVWDWLTTHHRVKQSEIQREVARITLSAAQRRSIAQLDEVYDEAVVAQQQLASLDRSAETAAESLRLARLRYTGGETAVLEVIDAQSALVAAENNRLDGRLRYRMALTKLQTLTGKM